MLKTSTNKQYLVSLIAILVFAVGIRVVGLADLPRIFNPDEAAIAYNAYLLAETNTDEWGKRWPITLQSFGDYKLIGYPAIVAGLFRTFSATDFLVRLPAAVAGTSLVLTGVLWSRWLGHSRSTQLLIALLFATTPVFFFYSRMAFEALVAVACLTFALFLWFSRQDIKRWRLIQDVAATTLFTFACVVYNTPLLLLPIILISIIWWRGILVWRAWFVQILLLLSIGVLVYTALSDATAQKSAVTIFGDLGSREQALTFKQRVPEYLQPVASAPLYYAGMIAKHTIQSFGLSFLVVRGGGHPWHALPLWGHLSLTQYALALVGLWASILLFLKVLSTGFWQLFLQPLSTQKFGAQVLLLFLTFGGLAPAIVTVDAPHATRSLLFFFCLVLLSGEGIQQILALCSSRLPTLYHWITPSITALLLTTATQYFVAYFVWFPNNHTIKMPVGFDIAIREAARMYPEKELAVVDPDGTLYIFTSWYMQYSPEEFFATIVKQQPSNIGFRYGEKVGQFHFIADLDDRTTEAAALYRLDTEWVLKP